MNAEPLKAFVVQETYEFMGSVHFARSNIDARKWGANEYNDGELGGLRVERAKWADKYGTDRKVPARLLIEKGWWFECSGCYKKMDSDLFFEDKSFRPIGGQFFCFCSPKCYNRYHRIKRKKAEFEAEFVERMVARAASKLPPDAEFDPKPYVYSDEDRGVRVVVEFRIAFNFPGGKYHAHYGMSRKYGLEIGPLRPVVTCAAHDENAFNEWYGVWKNGTAPGTS